MTVPGFGPLEKSDFIINGNGISQDVSKAISDAIVERGMAMASTVTLQMTDPSRKILRSTPFAVGDLLVVDGLGFSMVQSTKQSDQLQYAFEAQTVAYLRQQSGVSATYPNAVAVGGFAQWLLAQSGIVGVVDTTDLAPPDAQGLQLSRGTSADPYEDTWTCLQRVATSAGWRCFESNGIVYFGPDSFFLNKAPKGTIREFTQAVQNIDFDVDIGKPFQQANVTCMTQLWQYNPGDTVTVAGCGGADGNWLVYDMQRDLFNPQGSMVLQVPSPPEDIVVPPPPGSVSTV